MDKRPIDWQFVTIWVLAMGLLAVGGYFAATRLPGRTSRIRDRPEPQVVPTPRGSSPSPPPIAPRRPGPQ